MGAKPPPENESAFAVSRAIFELCFRFNQIFTLPDQNKLEGARPLAE
jgi:hypothetical protein